VPAQPSVRIGVSIVTFHSDGDALRITALGLAEQVDQPWRTQVHVNEASAQELSAVRQVCVGAGVDGSPDNRGFAGAHNATLRTLFEAGADAVLVLNPDLRLAPGALRELWAVADQQGRRCLVGPLLELGDHDLLPTGTVDSAGIRWTRSGRHLDDLQGRPLIEAPTDCRRTSGLTGACLLVPREAHDAVVSSCGEFFDEDFVAYREDAELGLRCTALGISCWLVPSARGLHRRGLRGTSRAASADVNRLGVQNRFLIRFKHGKRRPGNRLVSSARDLVVLIGAASVERSSWPGVRRAWALRSRMHDKRRAVYGHRT
jgi:GT2 family glycosyltransferase